MYFVVKNEIQLFTPKISVILADLAEAATFTATYLPSTSKRPCCFCLIDNEDLNNMALTNVIMRTPEKMREAIDLNQANELSIHADFNFFWKFKNFNIYEATVPDRMHMLDLGITKYLLEFTREFLRCQSGQGDGSQTLCDSAVSRPNRFKTWPGKYLKIYCKRLSQYNESDRFRYR